MPSGWLEPYNESDLSFLQRLCRRYGLWFYHDGQDYCIGRVKVQFPWQRMISQHTPSIKTSTPYSGSGKGFYFVPENGEKVRVENEK